MEVSLLRFAMNSHDWAIDAAVSSGKAGNQDVAPPMPLTKGLVYIIYNLFYWQQTQGGALNLGRADEFEASGGGQMAEPQHEGR